MPLEQLFGDGIIPGYFSVFAFFVCVSQTQLYLVFTLALCFGCCGVHKQYWDQTGTGSLQGKYLNPDIITPVPCVYSFGLFDFGGYTQ